MGSMYRYGETHPVVSDVASATVIEIGDLVYQDSDKALPAGHDTDGNGTGDLWDTNIGTTQTAFHANFLGVAAQRSRAGDSKPIRVNTTGRHEFDCAAAQFSLGDYVGPAKTSGNNLEDQKVVKVSNPWQAIGRVAKQYTANTTKVLVDVQATVMTGGPQLPASG